MNIRFEYLYRDAGNFKNWGEIIFSNKNNYDADYLEKQVRAVLIDKEFFSTNKANIPNLQFHQYILSLDHDWHEFYSFQLSSEKTTDLYTRDIVEFIESLKRVPI